MRCIGGKGVPLLAVALLLIQSDFASCQWLTRWSRPVISPGDIPNDADSMGLIQSSSGNSFLTGGGPSPATSMAVALPGLDGKTGMINSNAPNVWTIPTLPTPAKEKPIPAPASAHFRIHVPADAKIWVFDHLTKQQGEWRHFLTPPLENGQTLTYAFRARWTEKGKEVEQTRKVKVYPGDRLTVDFLASGSAE